MRVLFAVLKKEFRSYLASPMGYIYLVVFLILSNWFFFRGFFLINQASLRSLFGMFPWLFLLFVPAITMRLWAEERKLRTLEVLLTLPVKDYQVALGKFLASVAFLVLSLVLTLPLPLSISLIGKLDWGQVVCGYLGAILLGASYLAIGLFASSLSESQIVAFILGALFCFILFLVGEEIVLYSMPTSIASFLQHLGLGYHYDGIARGVIDSRDVIYYLSVVVFFLYLNLRTLEVRR